MILVAIIVALIVLKLIWDGTHWEQRNARIAARWARAEAAAAERTKHERIDVEYVTRRPTATRVGAGLIFGGLPGALLGFAFRKKDKNRITIYKP